MDIVTSTDSVSDDLNSSSPKEVGNGEILLVDE